MIRAPVLVALAGCNQIFGLETTHPIDGRAVAVADGLLWPPDGGTACAPPPDFSTWKTSVHTIAGFTGTVIHPSFLTHDRVVFMYQTHLFVSGADDSARQLTELEPFAGVDSLAPAASADGRSFWFIRANCITCSGVYYAVETAPGWLAYLDDPIVAYQIEPGMVGFYAGTARMVVAFQANEYVGLHLLELSSPDGLAWTPVGDLPMGSLVQSFDPALSSDGCYVLFAGSDGTGLNDVYISTRAPDGTFLPPTELPFSTMMGDEVQPTIDPTRTRVWFLRDGALIEAVPP